MALCLAAGQAPAQDSGIRQLSNPKAVELLQKPASMDAGSARVLARVTKAYASLRSLVSETRTREGVSVARAKRPRYYHAVQSKPDGELIALAVSDGRRYYEYTERKRTYLERSSSVLDTVTLPTSIRYFFPAQKPGNPMLGLDGEPAVRDYAFRYVGQKTVNGKKTDVLRVSTMVRGRSGWSSFDGTRYFDAKTGLLVRTVNGSRVTDVKNHPNAALPTEGFRWKPIPGAVKGFG